MGFGTDPVYIGNHTGFWLIRRDNAVYVSLNGSTDGDGSLTAPVATIDEALAIVRQKRADGDNREWHIKIAGGNYRITDTITLDNADSGTQGAPLVIEALNKNRPPRFTGGIDIPFSEFCEASESVKGRINDTKNNVMQIDLKARGITDYGELSVRGQGISQYETAQMIVSVDGNDMQLAGYEKWLSISDDDVVRSAPRNAEGIAAGSEFKYYDSRIESWQEPEKAWVSGSLGYNYNYDHYPVGAVNKDTKTVVLSEGAVVTKKEYPNKYSNHFFRFENVLEELDLPGEYYIDRENGMLYLYPPEGTDADSIVTLSMLGKNMMEIASAHDITIKDIEFHSGRKTALTTVGGGERISVENCKIHGFGKDGVSISLNTGSRVFGCEIFDIGENAVNVRGGDYNRLISSGNVIEENEIYRFAQLERSYKTGIMVGTESVGTVVRHNYIHDGPHAGIIFYGCNNLFENNYIERVVMEFNDMDAVYANNYQEPWERGNVIRDNFFDDIGNQTLAGSQINVRAIRTDNSGHGLDIYHNVFHNIGRGQQNGIAAICAQGTYNKVWENLFVDCSATYISGAKYDPERTYNTSIEPYASRKAKLDAKLPVYGGYFPELENFWNEHPQAVRTNEFKDNVVVNIDYEYSTVNYTQDTIESKKDGYIGAPQLVEASGNLVTDKDPGFADYKNGNYSVLPGSKAFETVHANTDFNIVCKGKKR